MGAGWEWGRKMIDFLMEKKCLEHNFDLRVEIIGDF